MTKWDSGILRPKASRHLSYMWGKTQKKPHPGNLSRPGIEPGPAAWQARMLPSGPKRWIRDSSSIDSLPLLKLPAPKHYLEVGRWNITMYSIHPFMDFFRLVPFLCEEFYHGTKLQISRDNCRPARYCTCHPPTASTLRQTELKMWLLHVKTCPYLHVQGHAWCRDVRYCGR